MKDFAGKAPHQNRQQFDAPLLVLVAFIVVAAGIGAACAFTNTSATSFLDKSQPDAVRVMTWNIGNNSIFPAAGMSVSPEAGNRPGQFARIVRSVRPDILCLQDVTVGSERTAALLDAILPVAAGKRWHAHEFFDDVIASRGEIIERGGRLFEQPPLRRAHATGLVELPDGTSARRMYVICSHFQSGVGQESVDLRQRQADSIASLIRDAKSPGGEITLSADTPFLVLGDLNVIDNPSHSLATLLSGDISNEAEFGPDAAPDWDGSSLTDLLPRHNGSRADFYTWRDDTQPFPPGALDRILYTDSMLAVRRAFVLNTMAMTSNELRRAGLRATDVMRDPAKGVHDHLPVVADLVLETGVSKRSHSTP